MKMRQRRRLLNNLWMLRDWSSTAFVRAWGCTCPRMRTREDCPVAIRRWQYRNDDN